MPNFLKTIVVAFVLIITGCLAAHNAKWVRDGWSPWWTSYIVSAVTASIYAYLLRANLFPLIFTNVFQTFLFHSSWYLTAIFMLNEDVTRNKIIGLSLVMLGMIFISIK